MTFRQEIKYYSSINPSLMKKALIRSTLLGTAGVLVILVGGTILPTPQLQFWGLPIFLAGLLLISLGLIPHRRLTNLEKNPSELWFDGETLTFFRERKRIFQIPLSTIDKIEYIEDPQNYGWGIRFKRPLAPLDLKKAASLAAHPFEGSDLFLPYFTERAWKEWITLQSE